MTNNNNPAPLDRRVRDVMLMPVSYPHPVTAVELIETHISCVFLTDDYVYKLKKPVVLDFVDFGSLERRHFFCEEEIRLNRPWAPDIYLGAVPITDTDGLIAVDGSGTPIEYAVKMRRFDQRLRLDRQLELGALTIDDMRELAAAIAARHEAAAMADSCERERLVGITIDFVRENFTALDGAIDKQTFIRLRDWSERELDRRCDVLWQRFDAGRVRECHGDLHLGNLVRLPAGITTFDCIEFNADLRMIDVFCDVGFLVMDLIARGRRDLAAHFLNRYLERSGDYAGCAVLDLYFVYRCLVRAKVAVIRAAEEDTAAGRDKNREEAHRYCQLALRQIARPPPVLIVMSGLSGSGKTRVSTQLMAAMPALRLRSDIERKRLFGMAETADSHSPVGGGIYAPEANERVYAHLAATAQDILLSGHHVILDAAYLGTDQRKAALALAEACGTAAIIVRVEASVEVLRARIRERALAAGDASEADLAVLEHQLATKDDFDETEARLSIVCDNSSDVDIEVLVGAIRKRRGLP